MGEGQTPKMKVNRGIRGIICAISCLNDGASCWQKRENRPRAFSTKKKVYIRKRED